MTKHRITLGMLIVAVALTSAENSYARRAQDVTPLLIGSTVPEATVADQNGSPVKLTSVFGGKNTILIFYRGGWCPYCTRHFREIAGIKDELLAMGYQIVAMSPDSPANIKEAITELKPEYELYSDAALEAADAFGITWDMPPKTVENMKKNHGHDLAIYSGGLNTKNRLPVPSVFIITEEGNIAFNYVEPKARYRIPGKLLMAAAETSLDFRDPVKNPIPKK